MTYFLKQNQVLYFIETVLTINIDRPNKQSTCNAKQYTETADSLITRAVCS